MPQLPHVISQPSQPPLSHRPPLNPVQNHHLPPKPAENIAFNQTNLSQIPQPQQIPTPIQPVHQETKPSPRFENQYPPISPQPSPNIVPSQGISNRRPSEKAEPQQQKFEGNSKQEVAEGQKLIEKVYVRDQDNNTVELKTYLCPDGSTKTERRLAINSKGELIGKFKETGVDLNDVMQIDQNEINRLIQENAVRSAQKNMGAAITPVKNFSEEKNNPKGSEEKHPNESPVQQFQFSTFQQTHQINKTQDLSSPGPKQPPEAKIATADKENLDRIVVQKSPQASPLSLKNQNQQTPAQAETEDSKSKPPQAATSAKKVVSTKEQATLQMPPSLANSIKGKAIKVRYKDFKGKTYPVGVSGPELTKTEKEWLLRKIIEKEGLTIEEVEEIEGGHLIDADDGSEYRLTNDKENMQGELGHQPDSHYKNQRGSNLVKDIQNQIINEQDEEIVSHSSAYPSQRLMPGQLELNAPVQKFDLMHRPPDSVNSKTDEIWFRTKEQKIIEDADQYRHIDMSKSSAKSPMMNHQQGNSHMQLSNNKHLEHGYDTAEKDVSTKFNYGTGQQYNPGFSPKYETGSDKKEGSGYKDHYDDNQYDPSDIDALLRHNENLLSKIKIDMKNIGESFVSHTDMGSSRLGLKNSLSGMYNHRNQDFDSKDMINRSPIGIQEFESFKTKTNDVSFCLILGQTEDVQSSIRSKARRRRRRSQRSGLRQPQTQSRRDLGEDDELHSQKQDLWSLLGDKYNLIHPLEDVSLQVWTFQSLLIPCFPN